MEMAILFGMVIALLLIGVPIAISLGLSSIVFLMIFSDASLASIAQTLMNAFVGHFTLLAIPFFILASTFMSTGGVAKRIIRFAIACVGHLRGGLAIASVFACMLFAALSGSSPATVVAIGSICIAGMTQVGYTKDFAAGVICNAGTLGILIPPSIVMVVYAASVASARDAMWGLFLIVIILGGIYGGIFTPTEAAAVASVYAFLIANFVYRDMGPLNREDGTSISLFRKPQALVTAFFHRDAKHALFEAGRMTIMLLFVIANALILKHVLTEEQIPQGIAQAMLGAGFGPVMFLVIVNVILLIGGQFMEPSGLIVIVAPLVFPIAISLGIDPIHLGIIMVVNMEIGMITPPVGLNLFVTSGVTGMPMMRVVKASLPWLMILVVFLIMVTYIPVISTFLPTTFMGPEIIVQ